MNNKHKRDVSMLVLMVCIAGIGLAIITAIILSAIAVGAK